MFCGSRHVKESAAQTMQMLLNREQESLELTVIAELFPVTIGKVKIPSLQLRLHRIPFIYTTP